MLEILCTREIEEQRYGRNKDTVINHTYIESGSYRKKFDEISDNAELNRLLYRLAKNMLEHRSGTLFEDMYWIDLNTMQIVAAEIDGDAEEQIKYSNSTISTVKKHNNLLTIHSHPNSFPPSISDINSNFTNNYSTGIIVCHDGTIYMYNALEKINSNYYTLTVEEYLKEGYNENDAQVHALNDLKERFNIQFKEVTGL